MTRRHFATLTACGYRRVLGANERVRVGFIGLGARGDRLLGLFLAAGAEAAALCDVYAPHLDFAARKAPQARRMTDYRRMLDDPSLDAVAIATPDHWHALQFIDACLAGKDVYVEKPLSLTVFEGRKMAEIATRTRRVVQVGTQRRSSPLMREAVEIVRSGELGPVTLVRAFDLLNEWPLGIGRPARTVPPPDLDWKAWLGPAPEVPYHSNRDWYNFRWFWHYSGGQLANMGVHLIDVARWALGLGAPRRITAMGGIFAIEDGREIPDTLEVLWDFGARVLVSFCQFNASEAPANAQGAELEFRGARATLYLHPDRVELVPERISSQPRYRPSPLDRSQSRAAWMAARAPAAVPRVIRGRALADAEHVRNFLDCIRTRRGCNAPVEEGRLSTTTCLLGNIALHTGRTLTWDARTEKFVNDQGADRLLHYEYRKPWRLPD